jgi:hypothetical protein
VIYFPTHNVVWTHAKQRNRKHVDCDCSNATEQHVEKDIEASCLCKDIRYEHVKGKTYYQVVELKA